MSDSSDFYEGIAIVGMAGRFPMAADIDEYWENLISGRECLSEFSEDEIVASGVSRDTLIEARRRTRGVLEGAADFDARFFGFSPREAEIMDPQQRIFLEVAWEALEDAGYDSERPPGPIGVYGGSGINTYFNANVATRPDVLEPFGTFPAVVLNEKDFISTRVAYAMDLRGPALTVQTACSSSLVAVCYAAQGLLNFECDVAIAGAAAAVFPQTHSSIHEEGGMISQDGHCRPFDADASGTLFSDGAGAVVLRRLSDALESGDHIRGVIRGFAVNNDGAGKAGFTAPSVEGQAEVIRLAQEIGGISPDTISYIEAHGTATPLGDPIEIAGLTKAFRAGTDRTGFCAIGSVKSNIGHLDVAAGIAGLIKTALALEHRTIPPTINFERPTPQVAWDTTPFHVADRLKDWEEGQTPRRAGVSSFGIGGTNAHVVVEEAPSAVQTDEELDGAQLMVLSAKTPSALETATGNLARHLAATQDELADVAFTLQTGRREFQNRRAVVCVDPEDARAALDSPTDRRVLTGSTHHRRKPVVFMFSGQGSQYIDMASGIYESEPVFKAHVDRCAEILQPTLGYDIREAIYPRTADREHATEKLRQTAVTQPALFVVEYALAMLWQSWGVEPRAMVGHSIGEYVAACLAGVFTLEDALSLVAARGRLMQSVPSGAMLSVPLTEPEIEPLLDERTCVSVVNSEGMCVVSGEHDAIDDLEAILSAQGVQARRVQTSHAFHSHMMEPILDSFRDEVTKAQPQEPHTAMLSNVTGTWITPEQAVDPDYWTQHLRQTVRFRDCLTTLLEEPDRVFLEVGPGRTLASLTRMHSAKTGDTVVLSSTRHPEESRSDAEFLLENVGRAWIAGARIDWQGLHAHRRRKRVSLPTYPFERQRYWLEPGHPAGFVAPALSTASVFTAAGSRTDPQADPSRSKPVDDANGWDDIERTIAKMWEDLLGVSSVGSDENFFDLGGSSLIAARMFALIAREYGSRLPLSTLVNAPTVSTLAAVIRDAEPDASSLVEMQSGDGTKPALFLIHPEGGNILVYRDLPRYIGTDWTVVGVQSRGLDGVSSPSSSIEEMAAQYVSEIRETQPQGPYYLGGWCLGGTIAFEMTKQLEDVGERVAWLGMIQARHTRYWEPLDGASSVQRLAWRLSERMAFQSASVSALSGRAKLRYLSEKVRRKAMRTWARVPLDRQRGALVEELAVANACDRAHGDAYWAYEPSPYDGRVALVRSSRQPHGIAPDPTLGWRDVLRGDVELYEIPSFHWDILDGVRSEMVGKVLRESLDAAMSKDEDATVGG